MKSYWDNRFETEGKIWGNLPSKTAEYALKLFRNNNVQKILIPGAGYGRNSSLFSSNGFDVTGIEISTIAYDLCKKFDPFTNFYNGSVLDMPFNNDFYDAIYCYNILHLFLKKNRKKFLEKCYSQLIDKGFMFFVVMSEKEKSFGKGKEFEKNTFESKPGRPIHYFTEEDLLDHFKSFKVLETGIIEDKEDHGKVGPHTHILRFIFVKKMISKSFIF